MNAPKQMTNFAELLFMYVCNYVTAKMCAYYLFYNNVQGAGSIYYGRLIIGQGLYLLGLY